MTVVTLDGRRLRPADVVAIARRRAEAEMAPDARERNAAAERLVRELIARGDLLYGVTTGVGALRAQPSVLEDPGDHQWRLLRSHAGGGGAPLTTEVVRAAMAVRANQLGAGGAGVGDSLLDGLVGALRADVTPFARELGSLGTGDLTVLAEIGVALGGEGECWVGEHVVPAAEALAAAGLTPVRYGPRDGLAFMSSNAVSIGQAALVFHDASRLLDSALGVAALSYDATDADLSVLDPRVHAARPHRGQTEVARRLRALLGERERRPDRPVHDAFVFRCVPQVEGTLFEALERLLGVLEIELNVAGENALMLPGDGVALPNGNFHAGVLTLALDSLRGAMAQSASLIAARVSALLDPDVTGLTPQLAQDPGPDSGAMILEYTAHAAAAEVRSLAATAASQTTTVQSGIECATSPGTRRGGRRTRWRACRSRCRPSSCWRCGPCGCGGARRADPACTGSTRRPRPGSTRTWPTGRCRATSRRRGSCCSRMRCGWTPNGSSVAPWRPSASTAPPTRSVTWRRSGPARPPRAAAAAGEPAQLRRHELSDLSPLAELRALEVVEVARSRVSDLAPLAGLEALRRLDVSRTRVADLSPLAGLGELEHLVVSGTRVSDLEPLHGLAKLAVLGLRDTPISDLSPVAALPAIRDAEQLDLSGTQLSSLIDLGSAPRLRELRAIGTPIETLPRLPALEALRIDDTRVHDLSCWPPRPGWSRCRRPGRRSPSSCRSRPCASSTSRARRSPTSARSAT